MDINNIEKIAKNQFLGVPIIDFESGGKEQLSYLLSSGLNTSSKILDIGCGVLRAGYWIIHFLNTGCYFGIEPHIKRLEIGLTLVLEKDTIENKKPIFDNNPDFDLSVFNEKFDFFLAYSIWTHSSKYQIKKMLDGFIKNSNSNSQFLTTFIPANDDNDYTGDKWFGTSHESDTIGCIKHDFMWIKNECDKRNLSIVQMGQDKTHGQHWIKIKMK